jgi:hypothetical protein
MKKLLLAIMLLCVMSGCAGNKRILGDRFTFHINGIDVDRVNRTIKEKPVETVVGALAAMAVHEAGHVIAMEAAGVKDYKFETPLTFRYNTEGLSDSDMRWISRAGFLTQAIVGTALTQIPATKDTAFTLGYTGMSTAQTLLYPLPPGNGDENDLGQLEKRGGHPWIEWSGYSIWSGINLYNTIKKPKQDLLTIDDLMKKEE